jgi:hypothetical protein
MRDTRGAGHSLYDQACRIEALQPGVPSANSVRLDKQIMFLRQPRYRDKGRTPRIVRAKHGFLAVQDWWVGAPPIISADYAQSFQLDADRHQQTREGDLLERLVQ